MRETVEDFERRTGCPYAPPEVLLRQAPPLSPGDACPTLFRTPGPGGLLEALSGTIDRLAPASSPWVWLADSPVRTDRRMARAFGSVAVLEPLRLHPCPVGRGHYLGVERGGLADVPLVWVPPSAVVAPIDWDRLQTAEQVARVLGPGLEEERRRIAESLSAYLEELSGLAAAGAAGPERPWLELPLRERRRVLSDHGVTPRWSKPRR